MFSLKVINENRNPDAQELFQRNTSISEHETLVKQKRSSKHKEWKQNSLLLAKRIGGSTQVAADELLFQRQWSQLFSPRHAEFWWNLPDLLPKGKVSGTVFGPRWWLCHVVLTNGKQRVGKDSSPDGMGWGREQGHYKGQAAGSPHHYAARAREARIVLTERKPASHHSKWASEARDPHLISVQEKCSEKFFLRPAPFQDRHYQFGIFTGLLGVRKREWLGSDCTMQA